MDSLSLAGAILWSIGLAVLFLGVIPLVLVLALRVLTRLREINDYAADILDHGVGVTKNLEPIPALVETRELVGSAGGKLARYVGAVDRLLRGRTP